MNELEKIKLKVTPYEVDITAIQTLDRLLNEFALRDDVEIIIGGNRMDFDIYVSHVTAQYFIKKYPSFKFERKT